MIWMEGKDGLQDLCHTQATKIGQLLASMILVSGPHTQRIFSEYLCISIMFCSMCALACDSWRVVWLQIVNVINPMLLFSLSFCDRQLACLARAMSEAKSAISSDVIVPDKMCNFNASNTWSIQPELHNHSLNWSSCK